MPEPRITIDYSEYLKLKENKGSIKNLKMRWQININRPWQFNKYYKWEFRSRPYGDKNNKDETRKIEDKHEYIKRQESNIHENKNRTV